jgi:aminoglycoside 3-N-acetyltransferase
MSISSLYNILAGIHPRIEVFLRKIYWNRISNTNRYLIKKHIGIHQSNHLDFNKILENIRNRGVLKGDLIVVHSSFDALKSSGKSPKEIINLLRNYIGDDGTLAMPVIRKYKGDLDPVEQMKEIKTNTELTYNVRTSPVSTGLLPREFLNCERVEISKFPLNTMAAVGRLAKSMVENNLYGDILLPHGTNSSWKFCVDNNAKIIGLGINLVHSLTILHTIEDCKYPYWPIKNWYIEKNFNIIDGAFEKRVNVLERRAIWGMCYYAEVNFRNDLLKNRILSTQLVEGIPIEIINASSLYKFLQQINNLRPGYPFFVPKKFLR